MVNVHQHAKLRADRSNWCRDKAIFDISRWRPSKMPAVRHLKFVLCWLQTIHVEYCWSLSFCKKSVGISNTVLIFEDMQMPIHAHFSGVLG